jgi:ubiquinone/menaquinone biosynthesis C-methylase UbiE
MNPDRSAYVCPETHQPLQCAATSRDGAQVVTGTLSAPGGRVYPVRNGIPDLTFPSELQGAAKEAREYYEGVAGIYDDVGHLTFRIQFTDEDQTRRDLAKLLELKPSSRVLEIACGTGRDSVWIAAHLGPEAEFYLQDITPAMLAQCQGKLKTSTVPIECVVANACFLPFPDNYFDAVFSFGGLGVFGDIKRSFREMVRVGKVGAKVVAGDESMPQWLYESEFGRILLDNNPLFKNPIPLDCLPVEARNVVVRYVLNGLYYVIEFAVGEGEPKADFDLVIPGRRGGTLRTRYHGRLEGVTPETKKLAERARATSGKSMHQWLDEVVQEAARNQLGQSNSQA